jgi:exonuclease III
MSVDSDPCARMTAPLKGPSRLAYKCCMRVATWNINDIRKRMPLLLASLEAARPDVVALQELKCTVDMFPGDDLARLGYRCLVVGQKTWNGVALLCLDRNPIEIRRALPGDAADKQARYVEAAVNA